MPDLEQRLTNMQDFGFNEAAKIINCTPGFGSLLHVATCFREKLLRVVPGLVSRHLKHVRSIQDLQDVVDTTDFQTAYANAWILASLHRKLASMQNCTTPSHEEAKRMRSVADNVIRNKGFTQMVSKMCRKYRALEMASV